MGVLHWTYLYTYRLFISRWHILVHFQVHVSVKWSWVFLEMIMQKLANESIEKNPKQNMTLHVKSYTWHGIVFIDVILQSQRFFRHKRFKNGKKSKTKSDYNKKNPTNTRQITNAKTKQKIVITERYKHT